MPGLVPGIHVFQHHGKQDVDGRNKSGHDDKMRRLLLPSNCFNCKIIAFHISPPC